MPLNTIKATYFFLYAVDGAILPFLALFLQQEHGLDPARIGIVLAVAAAAGLVSPPLLTLLADRHGNANPLLQAVLVVSAAALLALAFAEGYWWLLVLFTIFGLARDPTRPLLDGIFFSARRHSPELASTRFHHVRIWGTAGFMIPGIVLYFGIGSQDDSLAFLPFLACGLALATVPLAWRLPRVPVRVSAGTSLLRTAREALRVIARPNLVVFLGAMLLLQIGVTAYLAFYPLQVTDVGLASRWVGPLITLGVALELLYMAAFGWLVRTLGWRWFMVIGASTAVLRMVALATVPGIPSLIATQLVHGFLIVVTMVGARALLDQYAEDAVRYTVQGLYAMLVMGGGRILGNAVGGALASHSLALMFWSAAGISVIAVGMLAWALRNQPVRQFASQP